MLLGSILLFGPVGLYLALAALLPGRPARSAFGSVAAGLGAL